MAWASEVPGGAVRCIYRDAVGRCAVWRSAMRYDAVHSDIERDVYMLRRDAVQRSEVERLKVLVV